MKFTELQRQELRDAVARSRLEAKAWSSEQRRQQNAAAKTAKPPKKNERVAPRDLTALDSADLWVRLTDEALLATPEGQAVLARIDAATCEFCVDREGHVRFIALLVLRAKGL